RDVAADVSPCLLDERLVERTAVEKRPREAVLLPEVLAVDMGRRERPGQPYERDECESEERDACRRRGEQARRTPNAAAQRIGAGPLQGYRAFFALPFSASSAGSRRLPRLRNERLTRRRSPPTGRPPSRADASRPGSRADRGASPC